MPKEPVQFYVAEFDDFSFEPKGPGRVEVVDDEAGDTSIFVTIGENKTELLRLSRDQWGLFINFADASISQEDGTRSFLDAIIGALQKMREIWEPEGVVEKADVLVDK